MKTLKSFDSSCSKNKLFQVARVVMCGILCICGAHDVEETRKRAVVVVARLRHRGPDWSGVWVKVSILVVALPKTDCSRQGNDILLHERLSIVDPESGGQPLTTEDGSVAVCVNGEIYNHRELRKNLKAPYPFKTASDCEVILPLYLVSFSFFYSLCC